MPWMVSVPVALPPVPVSTAEPSDTVPNRKLTVPVGVTLPTPLTVAVITVLAVNAIVLSRTVETNVAVDLAPRGLFPQALIRLKASTEPRPVARS